MDTTAPQPEPADDQVHTEAMVDGYACPVDPMDALQCDACQ